jgi:AcrR family transcriptional regulator
MLLAAAREVFVERGFDAATVRMIASRGGVDPAMVNHWFGGKQGLFVAAIELPAVAAPPLDCGTQESLAERMIRTFVTMCDDAGGGEFAALVRSISSQELAARMLGEFVHNIVDPMVASLPLDRLELRAALCCWHIIGLGMARYVLGTEPLATADRETIAALVGPSLQMYLSGSSTHLLSKAPVGSRCVDDAGWQNAKVSY